MALIVAVWTSIILFAIFYKPPTLSSLKRKRQLERAKQKAKQQELATPVAQTALVTTSEALQQLKVKQKNGAAGLRQRIAKGLLLSVAGKSFSI